MFQYRNINISKYSKTRNTTNAEMFPAFKFTNNEILQQQNITNIETLPKAKNCQHRNITNMETLPKAKITNIEILRIWKHYQKRKLLTSKYHYQKRKLSAAKYHLQQSAINHEILHEYENHFRNLLFQQ